MSVESRKEEPVEPIRHRLAVRPVLVSASVVLPKFPRHLDKNCNIVSDTEGCKKAKHESHKDRRSGHDSSRHKTQKHEISKHNKHEPIQYKHKKHETKQGAVNTTKKNTLFLVRIPNGPVLKVPVGKSYYRIQHDGYKYSLLIDPTTGYLRHVHKRPI